MPVEVLGTADHGKRSYINLLKIAELHLPTSLDPMAAQSAIEDAKKFRENVNSFSKPRRAAVMKYARNRLKDSIAHSVGYFHPDYQWAIFGREKVTPLKGTEAYEEYITTGEVK